MTTWNPSDKTAALTVSGGNLTATSVGSGQQSVRSTTSKAAGKVYWEVTLSTVATNVSAGFCNAAFVLASGGGPGGDADSCGYYCVSPPQAIYGNNNTPLASAAGSGSADSSGNVIYLSVDFSASKVWISGQVWRSASTPWNGGSLATQNPSTGAGGITFASLGLNAGPYFALFNDSTGGAVGVANFGATAFAGTVPTGFSAWDAVVNTTGTISAATRKPASHLTGNVASLNTTGTISATTRKPVANLTGNVASLNTTGTISATTRKPVANLTGNVTPPVNLGPSGYTSGFYVIEASVAHGFADAVGPADQGWLAQPWLSNVQIEASPAGASMIYASDTGYRTRASDPMGVRAYPPTIVEAFQVDLSVNLDPTRSAVAAAWGMLTLENVDHAYDDYIANYQSDGQQISIYRGEKAIDPARGIAIDPPYASLVLVFTGVMGPWQPALNQVSVALQDASYYLEKPLTRTLYGGTGGADGTAALTGIAKPIAYGGGLIPFASIANITPLLIDPANLVYQWSAFIGPSPGVQPTAVYDGGVPLSFAGGTPGGVYQFAPGASQWTYDSKGLIRLGSSPVYGLTADILNPPAKVLAGSIAEMVLAAARDLIVIPANFLSTDNGAGSSEKMLTYGADPTVTALAMQIIAGIYIASDDSIDGLAVMDALLQPAGALLVPGRDGKLRILVLAAVPAGSTPVVSFDNTNIVSIDRIALPASVDPPPWRMRLAYGRNWTVQTSDRLGGAASAAQQTFATTQSRTATGIAAPIALQTNRLNDPDIIGAGGGSMAQSATTSQAVVNAMAKLWGVQRHLYEITVPRSVGLALDWASVVKVVSDFDGLTTPGKLGQIVGWAYSSGDPTSKFRVLV